MILIRQIKIKAPHEKSEVKLKVAKTLRIRVEDIIEMEILRCSLDARKKPEIFAIYSVEVKVADEKKVLERLGNHKTNEQFSISTRVKYHFPSNMVLQDRNLLNENNRPVIVGAGPAGLFCAYYLSLAGMRPIVFERGRSVENRQKDVERFWKDGILLSDSNVQFGEGGAGTFSDGKLNTLVKDKDGRNRAVLETFVKFGAKESILYDAMPHLGTDELAKIIVNLRNEILRRGGEIRFESKVTDFQIHDGKIDGITINETEKWNCDILILAIGHSARDTFSRLYEKKIYMEAKPFAVGFRVEHPQKMINESQYGVEDPGVLGNAPYKVTAKASNGRGVYSFCMCPGGYVVNASSEEGRLAVNGMSYSKRDGKNANSAIIISVTPSDYPGEGPLSGIVFQRELEEKAYKLGKGSIPVQRYGSYRSNGSYSDNTEYGTDAVTNCGTEQLMPQCKGSFRWADLRELLPEECRKAFIEGMQQFGRQIKGFDREDCILSGVESRTSSPVRIVRDEMLSSSIQGIYPCGEGAGYAGGITSAAMDGLKVGEEVLKRLTNLEKRSRI